MGHSLNRTSFRINQNLVIDDKTFNPGHILVSDIYGNTSWQNPNQYSSNEEPLDHFIGELYGGGIVVAVWREQRETLYEICLIASVKNYSEPYSEGEYFYFQWSNIANLAIGATARSNTFGASNSVAIINQGLPLGTTNPADKAASKCANYINADLYGLGVYGDWYLPSTFELNCLANNAAIVDRVISQYATDKGLSLIENISTGAFSNMDLFVNANESAGILTTGYWTSTEYNAGSAHFLNMGVVGGVRFATASKNSYKFTRPFRQDVKRWNGITWVQDRNKTGKVLIVYDQPAPYFATSMVANITATEVSLGNTVTVITSYSSIPANLSQYDHIWDINVQEGGAAVQTLLVPTGAATKYTTYLQQGGGLFILGENAQNYTPRNNDLASFITNLGGGNIQSSNQSINNSLNIESEFLIANNRNTVTFAAIGRFSSIGTGTPITKNPIDSLTGHAVVWKTGSLSLAPKGAIVVVLDFNFLSSNYGSGAPFYSQEFVANVSQILNKS
jgi:hypothetical protein